jgi:hypothetical protein
MQTIITLITIQTNLKPLKTFVKKSLKIFKFFSLNFIYRRIVINIGVLEVNLEIKVTICRNF